MVSDRTEVTDISSVFLRGQYGMLVLVKAGTLVWARPLSVPFGGHDGEEVVRFFKRRAAKAGGRGHG
jgi:hypothetical protein